MTAASCSLRDDKLAFWCGRRVLVTGHTGFIGSWLCWRLHRLGAQVIGYSLPVQSPQDLAARLQLTDRTLSIEGDVLDASRLRRALATEQPALVFHLAAQSTVQAGLSDPALTFATNVQGTAHLLDAVRACSTVRACLVVTSDKCYQLGPDDSPRSEQDALGGNCPYSASKAAAEMVVAAYREAVFGLDHTCGLATARPGNVLGPGDWAPHRLMPNCIRALAQGQPIEVHGADHVRSWQHVLDLIDGWLHLAQGLHDGRHELRRGWNFGPGNELPTRTADVVAATVAAWGSGRWVEVTPPHGHVEARSLQVSISQAEAALGWTPHYALADVVGATVRGYRALLTAPDGATGVEQVRAMCDDEISRHQAHTVTIDPRCAPTAPSG